MWKEELKLDADRDFILNGIENGFKLVDLPLKDIIEVTSENHKSALVNHKKVEARIIEEIEDGNYVKASKEELKIISPLAAIEKSDGDVRLIHDLSYPNGKGLNHYAEKDKCIYETVDNILPNLTPECYLAKCDLKWAYRSISVDKAHQSLTGLKWKFRGDSDSTILKDTALGMGARKSPAIFNRITQAIKRMMVRRGFNCHAYLDDFLLYEHNFDKCAKALACLIKLLRALGFRIAWPKVVDPCKRLVFLGIEIDLINNKLSLDPAKVVKIRQDLLDMSKRVRISRKHLEKLAGSLNWSCNVIPVGRAFMNSLYYALRQLNAPNHKARPSPALTAEWTWWITAFNDHDHRRQIWSRPCQSQVCLVDSCRVGGGGFFPSSRHWIYRNWLIDRPSLASAHINIQELAIVEEAFKVWAPAHKGQQITFLSDNSSTVSWLSKWSARPRQAAAILKNIASTALCWNIRILCTHIPGRLNDIADAISRLHSPGQVWRMSSLLSACYQQAHPTYFLPHHMSQATALFISPQVARLMKQCNSWIKK